MTNGNDLAYPSTELDMDSFEPIKEHNGLNKREYFAAMAMQGMCSTMPPEFGKIHQEIISRQSVEISDALIKELNK